SPTRRNSCSSASAGSRRTKPPIPKAGCSRQPDRGGLIRAGGSPGTFSLGTDHLRVKLEEYGLIGDLHTAALVGANGSIDWLCLPRFDADACFAALLGHEENGHWQIAPAKPTRTARQRYR